MGHSLPAAGSLVLILDPHHLHARYLSETGRDLDQFEIVHDEVYFEGFEGEGLERWGAYP